MKTLLNVNLVVAVLFGLGFVFVPGTMMDLYGVSLNDPGITVARLYGSAILSFAVLLYYAGRSNDPGTFKVASRTLFTYWLLGTIFLIIAQLDGEMDAVVGWGTAGLHAVFLVWYGVHIFLKR